MSESWKNRRPAWLVSQLNVQGAQTVQVNRYALMPYDGYGVQYGERYAALDNTTGELVVDAAGAVMTQSSRNATDWIHAMNEWAQKH